MAEDEQVILRQVRAGAGEKRKSSKKRRKSLFTKQPKIEVASPIDEGTRDTQLIVLPDLPSSPQKLQEALFQDKLNMILDANRTYKKKTSTKHRELLEMEEKYRYLMTIKDDLENNNGKNQSSIHMKQITNDEIEASGVPLNLSQLKNITEVEEAYQRIMLEYIEHQSILDQIIAGKSEKVQEVLSALEQLSWTPPKLKKTITKQLSEKEKPKLHRGMSRTFATNRRKLFRSTSMFKPHDPSTFPTDLPNTNTVSETLYCKDFVGKSKPTGKEGNVQPDDFSIISIIGQGAFGKVYLVIKKATGQLMAMKVMQKSSILEDGDDSIRHVVQELEFMRDLSHHPFIVSLYHAFQTGTTVSLVMEWIGGGTLFDWLVNREMPFSEGTSKFYAAQVLLALQAMHANDIVYRDLKLENILLDEDGYIRLSDFGLSARARRGDRIHSFSGTATYLAPEIINDSGELGHTRTVDLWCFGVMLFIMLTQEPPFWAEHYPDLFQLIQSSEIPFRFYKHLSNDSISILSGLLEKNPEKRLGCGPRGIAEVQDHVFFQSMDWKQLLAKKISPPINPTINKGKPLDKEEEDKDTDEADVPVDLFRGFSFTWNPNDSKESFLSEGIDILRSPREAKAVAPLPKRKNRIVVNFFLWIKEVQTLPSSAIGKPMIVKWKHESKKNVTIIGPSDETRFTDETLPIRCTDDRSAVFEGAIDNACIACDYVMTQDRKTSSFESRLISFQLVASTEKKSGKKQNKVLGKLSIDLRDYCFHKLEKTLIFTFSSCNSALVLSVFSCWKNFNGDLVDNYEKLKPSLKDDFSNPTAETTDPDGKEDQPKHEKEDEKKEDAGEDAENKAKRKKKKKETIQEDKGDKGDKVEEKEKEKEKESIEEDGGKEEVKED